MMLLYLELLLLRKKPLEEGILGEANMDGSIFISDKIQPGSQEERQVLLHDETCYRYEAR